jgi:hypothetical protein
MIIWRDSIVAVVLAVLTCLCSGCVSSELATYPAEVWPALRSGGSCDEITGSYHAMTGEIWPTSAARGYGKDIRVSLPHSIADVSAVSRPERLGIVTRVEIDVSRKQAKLISAWTDIVDLTAWKCTPDGALEGSIERETDGETTFNPRVKIQYELRRATDHSLVMHQVEMFTDPILQDYVRETWARFPAVATSEK